MPVPGNDTFLPVHHLSITGVNLSRRKEKPKREMKQTNKGYSLGSICGRSTSNFTFPTPSFSKTLYYDHYKYYISSLVYPVIEVHKKLKDNTQQKPIIILC